MLDWSFKFRTHVTINYVYENIVSNLSIIFNFTLSNANHLRQKLYDKITYINSVHLYSLLMVNITKIKHTEFDYLPLRFILSDTILSVLSIFNWDALDDLVPFVQFNLRFLYCTNGTKSRKVSQFLPRKPLQKNLKNY